VAGYRHDGARGGGNLKYEFRLKPGASVEDVRLGYRGAEGFSVGAGRSCWCGPPVGSKGRGAGELPADREREPTFEEWLKSKGRESDGQNSGAS
jgi:hypothetical protein